MNKQEIREKINKLQSELSDLEKAERELQKSGPEYVLADYLHSEFCTSNHTDGCDWFYDIQKGIHDWTGYAHKRYLEKSMKVISFCKENNIDINKAVKVAKEITKY